MSKKRKIWNGKLILFIFGILLLTNFISAYAVPQTYQQLTTGMELKIPQNNILMIGQSYDLYVHAFNIATGNPITSKTSCNIWLYNLTGNVIYNDTQNYAIGAGGENFNFLIDGGNFSSVGEYYYNVECADDTIGGFASSIIYVTSTGTIPSTFQGTMYILILVVSILILAGLLTAGIKLPSNNKSNDFTGYIIAVSNMKYLKMLCLAFAYLAALFVVYISWQLSFAYLNIPIFANIFQVLFYGMTIAIFPLFVVMAYIVIANLVRDAKIGDLLSRGFDVKN